MTQVTITIDDAHLATIDQVTDALRAHGLQVDQVLHEVGIITGSITHDQRRTLESIDGVAAVSIEQHHRLPPPDAPVQ